MGGRIASLAIVAGLSACARPNPAFGDSPSTTTDSRPASGTAGSSEADATTKGSTTRASGATSDPSASTSVVTDSSTTGRGSEAESDVGEATSQSASDTQVPGSNLLWISAAVRGEWATFDDDPCAIALGKTEATCLDAPLVIVGHTNVPMTVLPDTNDFLTNAPFYAATTGALVLTSFNDLLDGTVETGFVEALTSPDPAVDLYAWQGPVDEPALSCNDWSDPDPNGTFFLFGAGSTDVTFDGQAPCVSELRLLCACAGTL